MRGSGPSGSRSRRRRHAMRRAWTSASALSIASTTARILDTFRSVVQGTSVAFIPIRIRLAAGTGVDAMAVRGSGALAGGEAGT